MILSVDRMYENRNFSGGPMTGTLGSQCREAGFDPDQGTRPHKLQLSDCIPQLKKIPHAATQTWHPQMCVCA